MSRPVFLHCAPFPMAQPVKVEGRQTLTIIASAYSVGKQGHKMPMVDIHGAPANDTAADIQ